MGANVETILVKGVVVERVPTWHYLVMVIISLRLLLLASSWLLMMFYGRNLGKEMVNFMGPCGRWSVDGGLRTYNPSALQGIYHGEYFTLHSKTGETLFWLSWQIHAYSKTRTIFQWYVENRNLIEIYSKLWLPQREVFHRSFSFFSSKIGYKSNGDSLVEVPIWVAGTIAC